MKIFCYCSLCLVLGFNYFGFYIKDLVGGILVPSLSFYLDSQLRFFLDFHFIREHLIKDSKYLYSPRPESTDRTPGAPSAFVNIFFEKERFNKVEWSHAVEMGIHTVGYYTGNLHCKILALIKIYLFIFVCFS